VVAAFPGLRGRLISSSFARDVLPTLRGYEQVPIAPSRAIAVIARRVAATLGPAAAIRSITDVAVIPLLETLGFVLNRRVDHEDRCSLRLQDRGERAGCALVLGWGQPLSSAWRDAVTAGVATDVQWAFCSNGLALRIIDARRTWSRDFLEFDLAVLGDSSDLQSVLWSLGRAEALAVKSPLLEQAIVLSARHGLDVCRSLGDGVLQALQLVLSALAPRAGRRYEPDLLFEHSLTVLYRILFLLFAEARGLVPLWHPLYRDRYSIDAILSHLLRGRSQRGLWRALQAISRLAHAGCSAGELSVTAFNGRLFSPSCATAFDQTRVADSVLSDAIVAVGTTTAGRTEQRARIAYRDLDVEQLGAVYERVLDYQAVRSGRNVDLVRSGDVRKSTGTFYTPRAVTHYLVRRTLDPLLAGRSAEAILDLRVLDPAMGSGAFLVAACRHLARAVESALIREGHWHPDDITIGDRVSLRRQIASRCLFGVDLNPMAVQLARLSLWLATLSADKPLSFLDHHLVVGNSLVGAHPSDVQRQPPGRAGRSVRPTPLPLFDQDDLSATLAGTVAVRVKLMSETDDSAVVVRAKEQSLAALAAPGAALRRWNRALDLWCAVWFLDRTIRPDRRTCGELLDQLLSRKGQLPERLAAPLLDQADEIARQHRFLHWQLAFPEVFTDVHGAPRRDGGFDAVIGNPPWDMVRGDSGDEGSRDDRKADASRLTDFVREAGIYGVESRAHLNRYQLFLERALQLARPGGRIGLVLPAGVASDAGAAPLRRFLFDRADVDEITGLDNRNAIFPIHRSVRFVLLTCTSARVTTSLLCRFGLSRPEALEETEADAGVRLTRGFLSRLSGSDDLGIPDLAGEVDLRLLERISARLPRLGDADGWNAQFGRELNASDDRGRFGPYAGPSAARPVLEGKQIEPFRVSVAHSRYQLEAGGADRVPRRARLAYRDVASRTNRLTLIAAIIPARAVTTHTLFCLKSALSLDAQHVLCGLLNSYVANYFMRFRVNTHVTASLMARLPVPFLGPTDPAFNRVGALVRELLRGSEPAEEMEEYAELQAIVATLYGLSHEDFDHVLSTFPLIPEAIKNTCRHFLVRRASQ
jgi:hypothetical protein